MPGLSSQPRKSIDCRLYPSEKGCTLKISGTEEEVLEVAAAHAVAAHGHANTPELVQELRALLIVEPEEKRAAPRRAKKKAAPRRARAKK